MRGLSFSLITSFFILFFTYTVPGNAQNEGKVAGTVTSESGETLPGVQVYVEGTTRGSVTNLEGYYSIIAVPAGTHTLKFKYVGYADVTVNDVKIIKDRTTEIDVTMRETVIEGEEVVVTAERPIVQKDRTTTTAFVGQDEIESLPAVSVGEVIDLQAGVVEGHFRGGRTNEVTYMVNGVPINNPLTNEAGFEVEQNMVDNLEVITGVFNAEYGQATSGVVNIETKSAPQKWTGNFRGFGRFLASTREIPMLTRTADGGSGLSHTDFETNDIPLYEASEKPNRWEGNLSAGGPIIPEKLGVNLNVRYINDGGYFIGREIFNPDDYSGDVNNFTSSILTNTQDPSQWDIESTGDGDFVNMDETERYSFNGSIFFAPIPKLKLDYNIFYQDQKRRYFNHWMQYVPDGRNWHYSDNLTQILGARYAIGNNTFANFSYSYQIDSYESNLYGGPVEGDSVFSEKLVPNEYSNQTGSAAFSMGGNDLYFTKNSTHMHTFVGSITSQIDRYNQIKTGFQLQLQNVHNESIGIDLNRNTNYRAVKTGQYWRNDDMDIDPIQFAYYLQDKIELDQFIINAGVRFDYFDPDYQVPKEWAQASEEYIPDPDNPSDSLYNRKDAKPKYQVSPRLAVAFPISSNGVIRFSYGLFFQVPNYSQLYANPEYDYNPQAEVTSYGNPNIRPQSTSTFEIGLQQGFTRTMGMELTIYTKDIRNLIATDYERSVQGASRAAYFVNRDYGTVRGLTLSIYKRLMRSKIGWNLDYTLQFADGSYALSGEQLQRELAGLENTLTLGRLDWDRRHVLNARLNYRPIDDLRISMINRFMSGRPYTTTRNFVTSYIPNNDDMPPRITTDLRVFYKPFFLKQDVRLFLQVDNLFDLKVVNNVYNDSGNATETPTKERIEEQIEKGQFRILGVNNLDDYYYRQDFFGAPRMISVGLDIDF